MYYSDSFRIYEKYLVGTFIKLILCSSLAASSSGSSSCLLWCLYSANRYGHGLDVEDSNAWPCSLFCYFFEVVKLKE